MPKLNFLNFIGKSVSKDRVRLMCQHMELEPLETRLMLERFCDNKTIEQCDFVPPDQQRTLLPHLERKIKSWISHNTGFFSLPEIEGIALYNVYKDADAKFAKQHNEV